MSSADALLAQLVAQRLRWVPLDEAGAAAAAGAPAIRMQIDTPSQFKARRIVQALRAGDGDAAVAELAPLITAWDGITGALVLGAAVGSADPVPVHAGLFARLAGDRPEWVTALAVAAVDLAAEARTRTEAASGN